MQDVQANVLRQNLVLQRVLPILAISLLIEEGNCDNSDLSNQIAVKSLAIEIISDTYVFERKQLISVHDAALAEFSLTWRGWKNHYIFQVLQRAISDLPCLTEPVSSLPQAECFHSQTSGMIHN